LAGWKIGGIPRASALPTPLPTRRRCVAIAEKRLEEFSIFFNYVCAEFSRAELCGIFSICRTSNYYAAAAGVAASAAALPTGKWQLLASP